jgi:hypothetical protein
MHGDGSSSISLDDLPCEADEALFEAAEVCSCHCVGTRHLFLFNHLQTIEMCWARTNAWLVIADGVRCGLSGRKETGEASKPRWRRAPT